MFGFYSTYSNSCHSVTSNHSATVNNFHANTMESAVRVPEEKAFHRNAAFDIEGHHTEILLHKFQNRYLLFVTQYEKINNIFTVSNDVAVSGFAQDDSFTIKHKFGATTDEIECGINAILKNVRLPGFDKQMEVVFCLGLKKYNFKVLQAISAALNTLV